MKVKEYKFAGIKDLFGYFILFLIAPIQILRWFINPHLNINDAFTALSFTAFLILYIIAAFYFLPRVVAITEVRNKEIRFFKPHSNRWAPISQYRYIADGPDIKKVKVYKQNCKKIGTIPLKSAKPEEKREFLAHIEPWLIVRGGDSPVQEDCNKGLER